SVVSPRVLDHTGVWDYPIGIHREDERDTKLKRGKDDGLTGFHRLVRVYVEHQVTDPKLARNLLIRICLAAPQHGLHPSQELLRAERFGDVVISAKVEPTHDVLFVIARGEQDDGRLGV